MPAILVPGSEAFGTILQHERNKTMADLNSSPENVRAMLTEALDRLRQASEQYFALLEKGLNSSALPIATQAKQVCNFMQRNVSATFDLGDKLTPSQGHAGRPQAAVRILSGPNAVVDRSVQEYG